MNRRDLMEQIRHVGCFRLPAWEEIPERVTSRALRELCQSALSRLSIEGEHPGLVTTSMLQNYLRSGLLTRVEGKHYPREEVARLLLILILKQILSLSEVKKVIELEWKRGATQTVYAALSETLSTILEEISRVYFVACAPMPSEHKKELPIFMPAIQLKKDQLEWAALCQCYGWYLCSRLLLSAGGMASLMPEPSLEDRMSDDKADENKFDRTEQLSREDVRGREKI